MEHPVGELARPRRQGDEGRHARAVPPLVVRLLHGSLGGEGVVGVGQEQEQRRLVGHQRGDVVGVGLDEGEGVDGAPTAGEEVDGPAASSAIRACRSVACSCGVRWSLSSLRTLRPVPVGRR